MYNTGRRDQLDSLTYNDGTIETFSYDGLGNPTTYHGKTLAWSNVNQLTSYNGNTFTYDGMGKRISKNGTTYVYAGDKLIKEIRPNNVTISYLYGLDGIIGFKYGEDYYFYQKNLQGDVIEVINRYGITVANYSYDAFGNHKVFDKDGNIDLDPTSIGNINSFRYRGYYYDVETGFYYLQSRYYDPEIGRFISPDSTKYLDPESLGGLNLYTYCCNNPLMYKSHQINNGSVLSDTFCESTIMNSDFENKKNSFSLNIVKEIASYFINTFGAYIDLSHNVITDSNDFLFFGYESGYKKSGTIGDNSKPISVFATNASEWWKIWEYQFGVSINLDKFSYSSSIGLGELNSSIGWNGFSVETQSGVNKIGIGFSQTTSTGTAYSQYYIRTIPTLMAVICIFAPYLIPVVVPSVIKV